MHKVTAILNAVKETLTPLIVSGEIKQLMPSSAQPPEYYPSIVYAMGPDSVESRNTQNTVNMNLTVYTDIVVSSTDTDLDTKTIKVRGEIEKAMLADYTLGLPFVFNVLFTGQENPDYFGNAETYTGTLRLVFEVSYRTDPKNSFV